VSAVRSPHLSLQSYTRSVQPHLTLPHLISIASPLTTFDNTDRPKHIPAIHTVQQVFEQWRCLHSVDRDVTLGFFAAGTPDITRDIKRLRPCYNEQRPMHKLVIGWRLGR